MQPSFIYVCINSIHGKQIMDCIFSLNKLKSIREKIKWVQLGPSPLGTGFTIQRVAQQYDIVEPLFIMSGDVPLLSSETIEKMLHVHFEKNASATVLSCFKENPHGYGRIIKDELGCLEKIVEEKDANIEQQKIQWVNAGTYCIHPSSINYELFCIDSNNTQREYYLTDIFGHIKKNKKTILLCELPVEKNMEVFGVNTVKELEELQNYLLNSKANDKPSISLRLSMPVSVTSISLIPSKGLIEELERKKRNTNENQEK